MLRNSYYKVAIAESHRPTLNCFIFQRETNKFQNGGNRGESSTTNDETGPTWYGPLHGDVRPDANPKPRGESQYSPGLLRNTTQSSDGRLPNNPRLEGDTKREYNATIVK